MKSIFVPMNGETGSTVGPRGKLQTRLIKELLKKSFPNAKIAFYPSHYCCSAMINFGNGKIVFMSVLDYRYFPNSFYVRTAKSMNDWIGGSNIDYDDLNDIPAAIQEVLDSLSKEENRAKK